MNHAQQRLAGWIETSEQEGFLTLSQESVMWWTGLWASFALYLQTNGKQYLITDGRYRVAAEELAKEGDFGLVAFDAEFTESFGQKIKGTIAVDSSLSVAQLEKLKKWFPNATLVPVHQVPQILRRQKTQDEVVSIRAAQTQVDRVLTSYLRGALHTGVSERAVAFGLEQVIQDQGKFGLSFPAIVAFGENSAVPHHSPGNRRLRVGDNVLVDCGATTNHWCSDMTRNVAYGAVSAEYENVFAKTLQAQQATLERYKSGTKVSDLERFCRTELGEHAEQFTHSLGHGVGLEIHELPTVSAQSKDVLQAGEVVTCEPGVYISGQFGVRVEDILVVRDTGPEVLSQTPAELLRFDECAG